MQKELAIFTAIAAAVMATNSFAFEFGTPIRTSVVVTNPTNNLKGSAPSKKEVTLMNIKLTPKESQTLFRYNPKTRSTLRDSGQSTVPSAINLGMNGVPVLDQGYHGTCVTFAVTAALDAALGKGDYISQLCNLELGSYFEKNGYLPSGWEGSFGPWVLEQIFRFGIVNKENQKTKSCAHVTEYPTKDWRFEGNPMSLDEYKSLSEDVTANIYPVYKMNFIQRFEDRFIDNGEPEKVLQDVKLALSKGNRVTFGTFIVISAYCSAGACASHNATQDTWALTKEIEQPPYFTGGHEMVITGYDDKAVAFDSEGKKHQGLLKLRNSWGNDVGDKGDYYMTYEYFKKFVGEVNEIVTASE